MSRTQNKEHQHPLTPNTTKTGFEKDLRSQKYLLAFAFADEDGTLKIEQSPDQTDWYTASEIDLAADDPTWLVSELHLRWGRVKFENGSNQQAKFALYTCTKGDR